MATDLSLEIGSYSIRAAIMKNGKTQIIPLGYSASPYSCPSVFARLADGRFLFGDYAKNWIYSNPDYFFHITDVEDCSPVLPELYEHLFTYVLGRADLLGCGTPDTCSIVVPAYYAQADPRKTKLEQAAKRAGIAKVYFKPDIVALCSMKASIRQDEYALGYDLGYSGLTVSLIKRDSHVSVVKSMRNTCLGGRIFDGLLMEDMAGLLPDFSSEKPVYQFLSINAAAETAARIKENLSYSDKYCEPVLAGQYSINRSHFLDLTASTFASSLQTCKTVLEKGTVSHLDIRQLFLCGGCSRIPFVEEMLRKYFIGNGNGDLKIIKLSENPEYSFDNCLGAFYSNNNTSSLIF